jgi:hypothetical protein
MIALYFEPHSTHRSLGGGPYVSVLCRDDTSRCHRGARCVELFGPNGQLWHSANARRTKDRFGDPEARESFAGGWRAR